MGAEAALTINYKQPYDMGDSVLQITANPPNTI